MLVADSGNGFLVTQAPHADFQLRVEFWADTATNSGIFIRAADPADPTSANDYDVTIWGDRPEPKCGGIVDVASVDPMPKAGGMWNIPEISAKGDTFTVVLNEQRTADGAHDAKHPAGGSPCSTASA